MTVAGSSERFEQHARRVRSRLDPALDATVRGLLAELPVTDPEGLTATLVRGKKTRGVLLCLVAEALGGDLGRVLPRAVAVELVQAATLVHDDVLDRDTVRRGMPAVWTREGVHRAILVGDLLFSWAIADLCGADGRDGAILARAVAQIARGACLEPLERPPEGPCASYERIIRLKTAILFEAACRLGAAAAGAPSGVCDGWGRWGLLVGEAYQIADDLQDLRAWQESGAFESHRAVPLWPALLRFGRAGRNGERFDGAAPDLLLERVAAAVPALEEELAGRLASAARILRAVGGEPAADSVLGEAPRALVGLLEFETAAGGPLRPRAENSSCDLARQGTL